MKLRLAALTMALLAATMRPAFADDPQKLIDDAAAMTRSLLSDSEWQQFHELFKSAKGVVLVPDYLRAGFVIGIGGSQCIMVARHKQGAGWSAPSFCLMGEASFGLQIGAEKAELMMLIMTDGALAKLAGGNVEFGGDAGIAVGLVGANVGGNTTLNLDRDIYVFGRGQGLYGGVSVEGGWIGPDSDYNRAYYGGAVSAHSILIDQSVANAAADALQTALAKGG